MCSPTFVVIVAGRFHSSRIVLCSAFSLVAQEDELQWVDNSMPAVRGAALLPTDDIGAAGVRSHPEPDAGARRGERPGKAEEGWEGQAAGRRPAEHPRGSGRAVAGVAAAVGLCLILVFIRDGHGFAGASAKAQTNEPVLFGSMPPAPANCSSWITPVCRQCTEDRRKCMGCRWPQNASGPLAVPGEGTCVAACEAVTTARPGSGVEPTFTWECISDAIAADGWNVIMPTYEKDICQFNLAVAGLLKYAKGLRTIMVPWVSEIPLANLSNSTRASINCPEPRCHLTEYNGPPVPHGGWYRQMRAKLQATMDSEVPFVLMLDSKNIMVRSFDPSAPYALQSILPKGVHHPSEPHAGWLRHAASIFGVGDEYDPKSDKSYFWGAGITPALMRPSTVRAMAIDLEARLTDGLVREKDVWCRHKNASCADAFAYVLQRGGTTEFTLDQIYHRAVLDDRYPEPEFHREITPRIKGSVMHWANDLDEFLRVVRKVGTSSPSDAFFIGIHHGSEKDKGDCDDTIQRMTVVYDTFRMACDRAGLPWPRECTPFAGTVGAGGGIHTLPSCRAEAKRTGCDDAPGNGCLALFGYNCNRSVDLERGFEPSRLLSEAEVANVRARCPLTCRSCKVKVSGQLEIPSGLRAESGLTTGATGTTGAHPAAVTATGELKCGVLWFLHISQTGGSTVSSSLKAWARRPSSRWTYVDLYNRRKCEPGLRSTNMDDWAAAPSWQRVLKELAKPKPRVALQSHDCSPSAAALLPQLQQLNATLQAKGCGLHLVTVLREPVSHAESLVHFTNHLFHSSGPNEWTPAKLQHHWGDFGLLNIADRYLLCGHSASHLEREACTRRLESDTSVPLETKTAAVLAKCDLIGTTHSLTAFLARLATLVGHTVRPSETQLHLRSNIPHNFELTEADKRAIAAQDAPAIAAYTRFAGVDRLRRRRRKNLDGKRRNHKKQP